jgi:hypothetical protein
MLVEMGVLNEPALVRSIQSTQLGVTQSISLPTPKLPCIEPIRTDTVLLRARDNLTEKSPISFPKSTSNLGRKHPIDASMLRSNA